MTSYYKETTEKRQPAGFEAAEGDEWMSGVTFDGISKKCVKQLRFVIASLVKQPLDTHSPPPCRCTLLLLPSGDDGARPSPTQCKCVYRLIMYAVGEIDNAFWHTKQLKFV